MGRALVRIALVAVAITLFAGGLGVLFVGPWPVYRDSGYRDAAYFDETLDGLSASAKRSTPSDMPERLQAGWAERDITPPIGTPLGGYSDRPNDKRCTGVHDPVFSRALVLSDGEDHAVIVASDILMTTLNLAQRVWARVEADTELTRDHILFTSSHNHCGPGGYMPGLLGEYSAGAYDPAMEDLLVDGMSGAIIDAWQKREAAALAHVVVDEPRWIRNRTNVDGEDSSLRFLVVKTDSGKTCYGVRYSAHPNVMPDTYLEVTAEYPGVVARALAEMTGNDVMFIGGAVGAMGPDLPDEGTDLEKMTRMGEALATRVATYESPLVFKTHVDIQTAGGPVGMPSLQSRPMSANWRFSPLFGDVVGLPPEGWIHGVRAGDLLFLGLPYDSGGVIAAEWAQDLATQGVDLWVSSHCIGYCGYLNPKEFYWQEPVGYDQNYEWRLMDWFGPDQEDQFTELKDHLVSELFPGQFVAARDSATR